MGRGRGSSLQQNRSEAGPVMQEDKMRWTNTPKKQRTTVEPLGKNGGVFRAGPGGGGGGPGAWLETLRSGEKPGCPWVGGYIRWGRKKLGDWTRGRFSANTALFNAGRRVCIDRAGDLWATSAGGRGGSDNGRGGTR